MTDVLFVVSEEGYWGEECVDPLLSLEEAGVQISVATPTGSRPVLDERSVDPDQVGEEVASRVRQTHEEHPAMNDPRPLARVRPGDDDAVVFPGGHGTEWDINQDTHARRLLRGMLEQGGKALVVCHAVGILAFARGSDGGFLVEDRGVTGFPNAWEEGIVDEDDRLPDGRKLPYWVEDEVEAAGARWDAQLDRDVSVRVDGDLITARGPASSARAGEVLLDALGETASS